MTQKKASPTAPKTRAGSTTRSMRSMHSMHSMHSMRPPQQVRIIGGQWKRTPLPVIDAEGLRPTPDRVRETVFNWLTHLFDGSWEGRRSLDLFAGTGALGFEAASRGAARSLLVEKDPRALRQLEANKEKLRATQLEIVRGDAASRAQALAGSGFDVVFLDPPFGMGWLEKIMPLMPALLAPAGFVYAESEQPLDASDAPPWCADWNVIRADQAGAVFYHLLQRKTVP